MSETSGSAPSRPRAIIFGCSGLELTATERSFFQQVNPLGFILFRRNCDEPQQVRSLVADLRATIGRGEAPILIDQEGGRVARLRPPHWPAFPPAATFGGVVTSRGIGVAREATRANARALGRVLRELGITVDCAPVLDVPADDGHDVIGDRAFARDPAVVATLARAACEGLLDGGVLPIIKHIPGHGRATADSHLDLPTVDTPRALLEQIDFAPFRALNDQAIAMVAHVVYTAIDPDRPASISPTVVQSVIRDSIGFSGLLVSDDLSMAALSGDMGERARAVRAAGIDVVLHCNGRMEEMRDVAAAVGPLDDTGQRRWDRARARLVAPYAFRVADVLDWRDALLNG